MKLSKEEIENEVINLVKNEVTNYKDGLFYITEKVAIATRPLIRLLRKNYWGVFDEPLDPTTQKRKQWVPLTRLVVDSTRKLSDVDLTRLNFIATDTDGTGFTHMVRGFTRNWMYKNFFGEVIDDSILQMCIDGTTVWKTYTVNDRGKLVVKRRTVDILNTFIDPTADNIQSAQAFTERALLSPKEVEAMDGWQNTEKLQTKSSLHRNDIDLLQSQPTGEFVDVYESYALIPERLITGDPKDTYLCDAHIVVSGLETGDTRVHLVERNTHKDKYGNVVKPYEEMRYMKVPGRWAGVGPAEMMMGLQEWINLIVNLRITKNTAASLGLFKIRANAGITQQMFSNLASRGVIKLKDMGDIENLRIDEAGESSYRDEGVAKNWAFEVTSTYDVSRGASGVASASATATSLQDQNTKSGFTLVKDSIGHMLNRWMDRHFLPHVPRMMREAGGATIYNDFEDIDEIRERVVSYLALQYLDDAKNPLPSIEEMGIAMQTASDELRKNKNLFFKLVDEIIVKNIDTLASWVNETTDVSVATNNLINMSNIIQDPAVRNDFAKQALDLMGLPVPESLKRPPMVAPQEGMQPPMNSPVSLQSLTTAANVPAN
jgi:hypothetical protein